MLRFWALALVLTIGAVALPGGVRAQGANEISLDQARNLAVQALRNGDPGLAIRVSKGLLQADRRDPMAYFVIAQAHAGLDQPNLGRRAAARAYRFSDDDMARFQAAQLAARMAYQEGNPSLAQVWLRRTALYAPSEKEAAAVARDYRALRVINPWSFRLRSDLRPSSNVNNGADTALNIVDGVPVGGQVPPASQALSGLIASLDFSGSYRLRADTRSRSSLGARIYVQRVALSDAAKDKLQSGPAIPGIEPVRDSDFASTYAEISLRHAFSVGQADSGGTGTIELAAGESWYAQQRSYRFGRIMAERNWKLARGRARLTLRATAESRFKASSGTNEARILGFGAETRRRLGNGDSIGVTLAFRDADAKSAYGTFTSASVRTSYTFAKPVGPAKLSLGLVLGYSDYPRLQTSILPPTFASRQDRSVYADISLFFDRYDYAGFAPLLRIRTGKKSSNFSRFDSREFSVSLGFRSKF